MIWKHARRLAAALSLVLVATACERDLTDLDPADFPSTAAIFVDGFAPGVTYDAFQFSKVDALNIDEEVVYSGTASMRFDVPDANDPSGGFVGGVFSGTSPRNLSEYNALTFWGRASRTVDLDLVGLGLDGAGNNRFQTELSGLRLTSSWQQYAIPIPLASALTQEGGLFFLSEGNQLDDPYSIWIDEVSFVELPSVGQPQAEIFTRTVPMAVADVVQAEVSVTVPVGGEVLTVTASPAYYTWASSDPAVATVSASGLITKVGEGTAEITATLGAAPVSGSVTVQDGDGLAGVVFDDAFGAGIGFESFGDGAKTDAVQTDDTEAFQGSRSVRVTVPGAGDPSGTFAGGVFTTGDRRDLSGFDALTFYAKAARPAALDVAGFGNDNTGTSRFVVQTGGLALTSEWQRFVVPIPDPSRLTAEGGLFTFAEGTEDGQENTIWFDQIAFVELDELGPPQATLVAETVTLPVGETTQAGYTVDFQVGSETVSVDADARYFDWVSSDPAVATVSESGVITMVAEGSATITATLAGVPAAGTITVQTSAPVLPPQSPAPEPTQPAGAVISIYSDSYTDVPNEGLNRYGAAGFEVVDVAASGNSALRYSLVDVQNGNFQIIELGGANVIDAAAAGMTHFRFDAYVPGDVTSAEFVVGLVNIDPDNPPATRGDVRVSARSTPPIAQGQWLSFDIPLGDLSNLSGTSHIQQVVIDLVNTGEVYLDNLYFYDASAAGGGGGAPATPAPEPTQDPADVISIYSDSYADVPNEGLNRYGAAAFEVVDIAGSGNSALRYTFVDGANGNFQIMELGGANLIDAAAAGMTNFRFDVYFPALDTGAEFVLGLVNIDPGNPPATRGDVRVSAVSTPPIAQGQWLSFDVPLADLTGLNGTSHIQQLVVDLINSGEAYIDNIFLYDGS